ncbi:MAG: YabP/YqfC family sporulation protein [Clostridia bacterium]|nr:YabP/YqfC family sporulation protein [Clostridia bacterium]
MIEGTPKSAHTLTVIDRSSVLLTGVEDVIRFDEGAVVLSTVAGTLAIEGEGLHIKQMNVDSREFGIEGKINSLGYLDKRARGRGLWKSGRDK